MRKLLSGLFVIGLGVYIFVSADACSYSFQGTVDAINLGAPYGPGVDFFPTNCGHVPAKWRNGYIPPPIIPGRKYGIQGNLRDANDNLLPIGSCPDHIDGVTLIESIGGVLVTPSPSPSPLSTPSIPPLPSPSPSPTCVPILGTSVAYGK